MILSYGKEVIAVCQGLRLEKAMRLMKLTGDSKSKPIAI